VGNNWVLCIKSKDSVCKWWVHARTNGFEYRKTQKEEGGGENPSRRVTETCSKTISNASLDAGRWEGSRIRKAGRKATGKELRLISNLKKEVNQVGKGVSGVGGVIMAGQKLVSTRIYLYLTISGGNERGRG